ncbi:MAG: hypothetical protein AVDCRST_MAG73-1861 [uncultured Thermomicrobiales bacterium]|uniref:Uncharacterized protein n=1 Tax=uncultured Thermomicrobiales bacterium TaxID=1645740 RepID=A0A6J4U7H8_9BACT|nr:MAG: hypothetical protein AVDCRST_MAG73-1861 [uncultured Thermomicrobiales bacterium]
MPVPEPAPSRVGQRGRIVAAGPGHGQAGRPRPGRRLVESADRDVANRRGGRTPTGHPTARRGAR